MLIRISFVRKSLDKKSQARSPHLLPGCEALAIITSSLSNSVIVTSLKNPENKLQIDRINQYAFASRQWQGEQANITLDVRQTDLRKRATVFAKFENQIAHPKNPIKA